MMDRSTPILALVVPCYNEEKALPETIAALDSLLDSLIADRRIAPQSRAVFVDDGSRDGTWSIINGHAASNPRVCGLKLSFNAGHQSALMAGMMESRENVDCIISIDADLQHDIGVLPEMLRLFAEGSDIVIGVRVNRAGDSPMKRYFSNMFYKAMKKIGIPLGEQHADFRLLCRNVLDALYCYPERNLFLRGIIATMGFQTATVPYVQRERIQGVSKYSLRKMLSLAWNGITSFSALPLRISAVLSLLTLVWTLFLALNTLFSYFMGQTVSGWSSLMLTMLFLGAIQLFCIAVLGEYTAKIYIEVKRRPYYIVEKKSFGSFSQDGREAEKHSISPDTSRDFSSRG